MHFHAYRHYHNRLSGEFDLVIDQINTIPFFTPLWAGIPILVMMWQLAREVWWYESPAPLNAIGFVLEPEYLKIYRRTRVITFGRSTAEDLRRLGFQEDIRIVPVGIEAIDVGPVKKAEEPLFIYVGRLAPSKRVHEIVEAFGMYRKQTGVGRLALVGDGPARYVRRLQQTAERFGVTSEMEFCGWLRGAEKHRRMAEAHALLMASVREGWGLVVSEANACGTPAIVYNVPGLRDSVRNEETGLIVEPRAVHLCAGMIRLTGDPALYGRLADEAKRWSSTFTFDEAARIIGLALESQAA